MPEFDDLEQKEIRKLASEMSAATGPGVTQDIPPVTGKSGAGAKARAKANQESRRYQDRTKRAQVGRMAKVASRTSGATQVAIGRAAGVAGPFGAALTGGLSLTALTALIVDIIATRTIFEQRRREAEQADRGIDFFKQRRRQFTGVPFPRQFPVVGGLTIETILGVTADEFAGMAMGMSDAWTRLLEGEGWNSFNRIHLFRNRQRSIVGDDVRAVLDTLRNRANNELRTDGQITLGWKKTGVNGG